MKIRELRETAGLSKTDVAREMGVDLAAVSRWDSGESMPRAAKLPKLAALFHCTIDDLFGEPDNKTPRPGRGREHVGLLRPWFFDRMCFGRAVSAFDWAWV